MTTIARRFEGTRRDPFRNFNFRIVMGGVEVAACRKMSALDATVNVVKFRAGNSPSSVDESMPGRTEYPPVTFESGVTNDPTFEEWAYQLIDHAHQSERQTRLTEPEFRRDIEVRVLDVDGTEVRAYKLFHCFVSKYTHISDLAADGNDVLIETLEVTHEGYTRIAVETGG
ncbi:phage tail protein [uncultured Cellulomonas sp.]|uniref:phage tail protein n=1 Tax=uncultured Cellulomonas sp. TaxID=189682 RepID=UPI00261C51DA|nr:phage tail protein [uncultured Cellulomonas sp.]